jgi:hypothetical protein
VEGGGNPALQFFKMLIKYTGLTETLLMSLSLNGKNTNIHMQRNVWYDFDEVVGQILLKKSNFVDYKKVDISKVSKDETVLIQRMYALGDLIQLVPVIRFLKDKYSLKFDLKTSPQFVEFMKCFNIFEKVHCKNVNKEYNVTYVLDGVLEDDHSTVNDNRLLHRVKIYENFFNIEIENHDFGIN